MTTSISAVNYSNKKQQRQQQQQQQQQNLFDTVNLLRDEICSGCYRQTGFFHGQCELTSSSCPSRKINSVHHTELKSL